jgi:peptidoglycan hydrolase-like protein with peptidoglycan-binding domain
MQSILKFLFLLILTLGSSNLFANSKSKTIIVQKKLTELGYNPGPIDGIKGYKTRSAIINFKNNLQLKADGKITPTLLNALNSPCKRIFIQGQAKKQGACKKTNKSINGSEIWEAKPGEEPIEIIFD